MRTYYYVHLVALDEPMLPMLMLMIPLLVLVDDDLTIRTICFSSYHLVVNLFLYLFFRYYKKQIYIVKD